MNAYKGRKAVVDRPVKVYRNLNKARGDVWYSVVQGGRVIAHTQEIALIDCRFRVRESGRQRVLTTGTKNVHAFVEGYLTDDPVARGACYRARYRPQDAPFFTVERVGVVGPLHRSKYAYLNKSGIAVDF